MSDMLHDAVIDKRTKENILAIIREKAKSYTPEWHMDETNPDIGTALAMVWAEMFGKTVRSYNRIPLKNCVSFFNSMNASLLPAMPAEGYTVFSLASGDVGGTEAPMGTAVTADAPDGSGVIRFETTDDLFVTPALPDMVFQTDGRQDRIYCLCEGEGQLPENGKGITFFASAGENLQKHTLYLKHDEVLYIKGDAFIELRFFVRSDASVDERYLRALADPAVCMFSYFAGDAGWLPFGEVSVREGSILLRKFAGSAPFALREEEDETLSGYYIRCEVSDIKPLIGFEADGFRIRAKGRQIACDAVTTGSADQDIRRFFPFGERFSLYDEIYFGCREVLCKKDADVTVSFNLDFHRIPIENQVEKDPQYKWIANRKDFIPDPEYDVVIRKVLWEYYNGFGWKKLFEGSENEDMFTADQGVMGQYKTMTFRCPADMAPILIGAGENYFIRARIIKADNLYKLRGDYLTPELTNLTMAYTYADRWQIPQNVTTENNLQILNMKGNEVSAGEGRFTPFRGIGYDKTAVYLGFSKPPAGAPIRILFLLGDRDTKEPPHLTWEYRAGGKWRGLNMADETESFSHSGLCVMLDNAGITKETMFGKERYWLRITDADDAFGKAGRLPAPTFDGIYMNAVRVRNVDLRRTELFRMDIYKENMKFTLEQGRLIDAEVSVNEKDSLSDRETAMLVKQRRAVLETDENGLITAVWVKWEQVEDMIDSKADSRHYTVNKTEGYILFGNGRCGRIPSASRTENIKVEYACGGGGITNLPANAVSKLDRSVGFVSGVANPDKLYGGCDSETLSEAVKRNAVLLRTQNKPITARDYEELVKCASRSIRYVKCFAGYDPDGNQKQGALTLVVLCKDPENRAAFHTVREEILDYLKEKAAGGLISLDRIYITEPKFVEMKITAELVAGDMNRIFSVKKAVASRLAAFLDAFRGNFDGMGWRIGRIPNEIQIRNAISGIDDVEHIRNIFITYYIDDKNGRREVDITRIGAARYLLPRSGDHEVLITSI